MQFQLLILLALNAAQLDAAPGDSGAGVPLVPPTQQIRLPGAYPRDGEPAVRLNRINKTYARARFLLANPHRDRPLFVRGTGICGVEWFARRDGGDAMTMHWDDSDRIWLQLPPGMATSWLEWLEPGQPSLEVGVDVADSPGGPPLRVWSDPFTDPYPIVPSTDLELAADGPILTSVGVPPDAVCGERALLRLSAGRDHDLTYQATDFWSSPKFTITTSDGYAWPDHSVCGLSIQHTFRVPAGYTLVMPLILLVGSSYNVETRMPMGVGIYTSRGFVETTVQEPPPWDFPVDEPPIGEAPLSLRFDGFHPSFGDEDSPMVLLSLINRTKRPVAYQGEGRGDPVTRAVPLDPYFADRTFEGPQWIEVPAGRRAPMCAWLGERSERTCIEVQVRDADGALSVISTDPFDPIPRLEDL